MDNSFKIAAGERWRSGNAGMTGSFCHKSQTNWKISMNWLDFRHVKLNFCASSAQYDILDYQSTKKCEQNTLKIFISLFIFTLLYSDSLSFSDDVAKTTRTGKTRRRMCLSGNKSAKSNSNDSTAKTIRTWRISSTLFRVKDHILIPTILFSLKKEEPDRRLFT